jgi:DNA-binding SARP family transcriptional activator
MRFEVLGRLKVVDGDSSATIGAAKMEALLAVLLVRADHIVPVDQLMREIWVSDPPSQATAGLHVYVSRLRKLLSEFGHSRNPIVTRLPGYRLRLGSDEIDYRCFRRLVQDGRAHAMRDQHPLAVDYFTQALSIWNGSALEGIHHGPILEGFVAWLTETRLECTEMLIDSRLALGQHRELVGQLYALVAENPLHEAFQRQLMLALYRSRRQADALRAYRSTQSALANELGLEPSPELQELHHAILRAEPWLDLCAPGVSA